MSQNVLGEGSGRSLEIQREKGANISGTQGAEWWRKGFRGLLLICQEMLWHCGGSKTRRKQLESWTLALWVLHVLLAVWQGAEAKGRRSRAMVDPCPAQKQLRLAFSLWCLAKCFGVSLLFVFLGGCFGVFLKKNKTALVGSLFLIFNMPCDFSIS